MSNHDNSNGDGTVPDAAAPASPTKSTSTDMDDKAKRRDQIILEWADGGKRRTGTFNENESNAGRTTSEGKAPTSALSDAKEPQRKGRAKATRKKENAVDDEGKDLKNADEDESDAKSARSLGSANHSLSSRGKARRNKKKNGSDIDDKDDKDDAENDSDTSSGYASSVSDMTEINLRSITYMPLAQWSTHKTGGSVIEVLLDNQEADALPPPPTRLDKDKKEDEAKKAKSMKNLGVLSPSWSKVKAVQLMIHSNALLQNLKDIDLKVNWYTSVRDDRALFVRPFKFLILREAEIRERFRELEKYRSKIIVSPPPPPPPFIPLSPPPPPPPPIDLMSPFRVPPPPSPQDTKLDEEFEIPSPPPSISLPPQPIETPSEQNKDNISVVDSNSNSDGKREN